MLNQESLNRINKEIAKYPVARKQSAVMAALHIAQEEKGWLSNEVMDFVAELLEIRPIQVYEVATFYSMYELAPAGKHKICICTNVSCMLCGSDTVVAHLEKKLGVKLGQTTDDGRFTLKEVECLAVCGGAPMMQIDKQCYENLTPEKIDSILETLE
ncbi:MAG TPA: NADH-quinone oxidoreductase subunit NuoE [Acidiferrobacteraceae bacterium]|nr:NADH-quinone oxidoreductase subunit NuoE [Acidiferrobacteraceae bacterium]